MSGGEFDWGGRLRKGIGGAQRFPQNGWKPVSYTHLDVYKRQDDISSQLTGNQKAYRMTGDEFLIEDLVESNVFGIGPDENDARCV